MAASETIYIYNENCGRAARQVPQRELDRYDDPEEGSDWTGYELTEETAAELEARGGFAARVARTIREAI